MGRCRTPKTESVASVPANVTHNQEKRILRRLKSDDTPKQFRWLMNWKTHLENGGDGLSQESKSVKDSRKRRSRRQIGDAVHQDGSHVVRPAESSQVTKNGLSEFDKGAKKNRDRADRLKIVYKERLARRRGLEVDDDGRDLDPNNWRSHSRDDSPDPFARLTAPPIKFGEVADRPPELPKLHIKGGVPRAAGSQARRELLEAERERFIQKYRELKAAKELEREQTQRRKVRN